ncbi:hypothetical protein IWX87_003697 [Polaromonas sp. CG_9.7]|uniref:DUF1631 family protein n=2 Tax=Polaromonas TaxID=52972 RepID=UPI0018CBE301|nr:DUF1631 family protein [Polaromonas sp. CG_23.6]MBG6073914.1 hypothetical protein [Polaromonas sp. CG_9.7]MBG6115907.1 hypothetical protein [Polaromonas sp. CG_9.2]MDH6183332.1 hypothetical protein [Polaromonas sp. CG_23.6]
MPSSNPPQSFLAGQARTLFAERVVQMLPGLAKTIGDLLSELALRPGNAREMQDLQDAFRLYQNNSHAWIKGVVGAVRKPYSPSSKTTASALLESGEMQLVGNETVEHRILASRLALRMLDFSSWELNDLRLRIQSLEGLSELNRQDLFRPEVVAQHVVEQWTLAGLPQSAWLLGQDIIHKNMAAWMLEIYHATNAFLIERGVMVEIDLRPLVRRTPSAVNTVRAASVAKSDDTLEKESSADILNNRNAFVPGRTMPTEGADMAGLATPLARVRMRAQGVLGHLKQLLVRRVDGFDQPRPHQASPQLANAMDRLQQQQAQEAFQGSFRQSFQSGLGFARTQVDQALQELRQRTSMLKKAASSSAEKATIEIVALMFQSILAEDRIAPQIRVWFARLQMPVLRVAVAEPEFFSSLEHPARQLIDRMGSCALGFDVTVEGDLLELEIKRVVQVIEQYPETGRRVFQLVYEEFDKFLSRFFAEQGSVARAVSLAQQLEQKETMTVQYTIEMRTMLDDMPVREEIREFLFRIWAEVLAIAAMKNGPQHAQTLLFKQAAADLVWSASAKPDRSERSRVIAALPRQLQLLRQGMTLLGLGLAAQNVQLKTISDTMADAFMSKTDAISSEKIDAMARRLTNLEDYLSEHDVGDLPLDADSLVTMIGIDSAHIEVIANGGSQPTDDMLAWARELQPGSWFNLDHNGKISHVQFAWCSERKQLHLFAAADGRSFLIQMRRLAAYLQARLLVPREEEALTVRATRNALAKLDANPERLFE